MRLTVVGCSGSFPGPGSAASCYLVEADGFRMLLDIGNGAVGAMQRHLEVRDLDAVLVSHLHPDHCIDLLALYVARTYDPRRSYRPLLVHVPSGGAEHFARAYGRAEHPGLVSAFDFHEWSAGPHPVGPFTVTVARMAHPVQTWGMRVEHGGRVLAYSGDTGPCDALVELARDADIALVESSFEAERDTHAPPDLHLTGEQAGEAAARAGAQRLVLTHLPPWNDPEVSRRAAESTYDGPVELAVPGATYDL
ncbi:MAG: MBL fold metallo-hydrolase [Sporichthyaceae bacterium]